MKTTHLLYKFTKFMNFKFFIRCLSYEGQKRGVIGSRIRERSSIRHKLTEFILKPDQNTRVHSNSRQNVIVPKEIRIP